MSDQGARTPVSVVIPAFNAGAFVGEAIESVLAQHDSDGIEVIVVDDGSDDDTAAVARAYPQVRLHRQPHLGAATARNRGVELAGRDLLTFLDADDVWHPEKLTRQRRALEVQPDAAMIFCRLTEFMDESASRGSHTRHGVHASRAGICPSALLLRRADFLAIGPFDPTLRVGEFIDWHARATETGVRSVMLPDVLVQRRVHAGNTGVRQRHNRSDYARVLKAALDRRRR